ncbi:C40 family peptidase [Holzapfeliella floricola]|uniref:Cell wall-associated hydrolase n=1 Tax=Holzapfeliella floricola DSM 23037 = JCM 16512 TaxID=1423744 RepID=A0A0R2DWN1_9LACO|nr:C40 family peptidase [Holzapfeliella floricola]KRN04596.1 cell wall-associated hydrolase [Holzapfeliella floricola DSM 23037 = JCM 16512]
MKNFTKRLSTITSAAFLGIAGVAAVNNMDNNANQQVQAAEVNQTVQINYVSGYSVAVWSGYQGGDVTGQTLAHGSQWKVTNKAYDYQGNLWYDLGNNQWVKGQYVVDAGAVSQAASSQIQSVINMAQSQGGIPYVWGGKTPAGFDCSGLMQYVFAQATGRQIGGYTVAQESAGRKVSVSQLQAGDLVFWGSQGNSYHVGLYIGNGQYIHAPQPGEGVKTSTISSYFMPSFGVRVL